jgi:hypothetical protein
MDKASVLTRAFSMRPAALASGFLPSRPCAVEDIGGGADGESAE